MLSKYILGLIYFLNKVNQECIFIIRKKLSKLINIIKLLKFNLNTKSNMLKNIHDYETIWLFKV